ncbi:MAG: translocation/assembly module TamB domain-containing protein [Deltaproteobacteria bacterium]|nr:translocation/assembly module TamB domain-containing protein [Deltaproteobacteria bacterium]
MRVVRRILLIVFIVIVVVVAAAAIYLNSSAAKRHVRALILREMNETWGIPTEFDDLEVRLFPLSVTVYGLRISHPSEGKVLEARALTITPDAWSLLRGRYRFEEVALVDPVLHLKVRNGQLVNLPRPQKPSDPDAEAPLLDAFALVDGRIELEVEGGDAPPASVRLDGVNLDLTASRNEVFELRALISGGDVRWGDFVRPLRRFEARVGLTPAELRVRRLALELGDDVRVTVDHGLWGFGADGEVHAAAQLAAPLELLEQFPRSLGLPLFRGAARVSGQVDFGPPPPAPGAKAAPPGKPKWSSRLDVALERFRVADVFVGDIGGIVAVGDDAVRAEKLRIDTGIGILTVDGDFRFGAKGLPYEGDLKMDRLEFAPLLERLGVPRSKCTQTFDGEIHLLGTGRPFHLLARTDTDVSNFAVFDTSFRNDSKLVILDLDHAHAVGGVEVDSEKLVIIPTDAVTGDSKHLVTGSYRFADSHFTLDIVSDPLVTADLGELLEIGIGGTGPTHTLLDGPMTNLTITAEMALRDFRYLDMEFGNIRADLHYLDNVLAFPEIHASTGDSRYDVTKLTFDLADKIPGRWTAAADITANPIHVADVPRVIRGDPAGWADVDGWVEGTAHLDYRSWTDAFDISFDGRARRVTVRGEPLDLVAASGRYRGGVYDIPRLHLERLGGWLDAGVRIGPRRRLHAEFRGADIPLHRLLDGVLGEYGLEANAALRGEVDGTLDAFSGRASATLSGTELFGQPLGEVALDVFLEPSQRLRLVGGTADGRLRFDAQADLGGRTRVGATFEFTDLEPFPFLADDRLDGYRLVTSGRTTVVAELGRTVEVEGKAELDAFALDTPRGRVEATEPVWLSFDQSGLELRRGSFTAPGGSEFTMLGYAGKERLALDVRGTADLALVLSLFAGAEALPAATGRLEIGAWIGGTLDAPQLVGTVGLHDGRVPVGAPYGDVTAVEAQLTLGPGGVTIDRGTAEFLGGHVRLTGSVALAGLDPQSYDLGLDFGGVRYDVTSTLPVWFDGTLRVTGDERDFRPLVTGDVWITRLLYTDPVRLGVSLAELGRTEVAAVPSFRPEDDLVRFDVRLHGEGLRVRNNLIDAAFRIDDASQPFRIVGTNQLFGLVGAVVIDQGEVMFRRSVFDITRGVVTFDSPWRVDPRFDVVAETEVRDWRITLTATGRRDDLRLLTTSQPELSEEDVVLLLTLGMTREEVEMLGAEGAAAGALAEVFDEALGVSERVGRYVPIFDQMRLTTEYSQRTGRSEPRITVGRRISDDARIEASSAVTDTRDFRAVFSYDVTDRMSIEGVYDNNNDQQFGNVGADIRWRIEF